jgi:hypothetical protein
MGLRAAAQQGAFGGMHVAGDDFAGFHAVPPYRK